jgi:hypothetical protein
VPDEFERRMAEYRRKAERRRADLRLANEKHGRARLGALRRLYRDESYSPRANRRPALVLAVVFLVLVVVLVFVARASGVATAGDSFGTHSSPTVVGGLHRPAGASLIEDSRHQIRSTICSVFTSTRCGPAIRVATCETGGTLDPRARGRLGERGLFQIHPVHFGWLDERRLYEPRYNARAAFRLSRGGRDWSPWTCQP